MDMPLPWRPPFVAALTMLARVGKALADRAQPIPILVGGGAAELYSASELMTGDIDVVSPVQDELECELQALGFRKASGAGRLQREWVHEDISLGFEVVASTLFNGLADAKRTRMIDIEPGLAVRVVAIEDLIADRVGQYASGSAPDMLDQARRLFAMYPDSDQVYLNGRIREEACGDCDISVLTV